MVDQRNMMGELLKCAFKLKGVFAKQGRMTCRTTVFKNSKARGLDSKNSLALPEQWKWTDLIALEPRLQFIDSEADKIARGSVDYDAVQIFYASGGLKDRLSVLVGAQAQHPQLRREEIHDFVADRIYNTLSLGLDTRLV